MFTAAWCYFCHDMSVIFDQVAQKLSENKDLVFGRMDSHANEVEGLKIVGYPNVKIFPRNNKKYPIQFDTSKKNEEELIKFIKTHATVPVANPHDEM